MKLQSRFLHLILDPANIRQGGAGQYRVRGRSRLESRAVCCVLARVPPVEAFQLCSRPAGGVYGVVVLLCGCAVVCCLGLSHSRVDTR